MIADALMLTFFLGIVALLCWVGFKVSSSRQRRDSLRSGRHRSSAHPAPTSDESTRITPPA